MPASCSVCARLDTEKLTELAALLSDGCSWHEVADAVGMNWGAVRRHVEHAVVKVADLRERGLRRRPQNQAPAKALEARRQQIDAQKNPVQHSVNDAINELIALKKYGLQILARLESEEDFRGLINGINTLRLVILDVAALVQKLTPAVEVESVDTAEIRAELESLIEAKIQAGIQAGTNGG